MGRGVPIQSWQGQRRRFEELYEDFDDKALFRRLKDLVAAPETLYVLGTNRDALYVVLEELKKRNRRRSACSSSPRIPTRAKRLLPGAGISGARVRSSTSGPPAKFQINAEDPANLEGYNEAVADDRVLLLAHGSLPRRVTDLRRSLAESETYYDKQGPRRTGTWRSWSPGHWTIFGFAPGSSTASGAGRQRHRAFSPHDRGPRARPRNSAARETGFCSRSRWPANNTSQKFMRRSSSGNWISPKQRG